MTDLIPTPAGAVQRRDASLYLADFLALVAEGETVAVRWGSMIPRGEVPPWLAELRAAIEARGWRLEERGVGSGRRDGGWMDVWLPAEVEP